MAGVLDLDQPRAPAGVRSSAGSRLVGAVRRSHDADRTPDRRPLVPRRHVADVVEGGDHRLRSKRRPKTRRRAPPARRPTSAPTASRPPKNSTAWARSRTAPATIPTTFARPPSLRVRGGSRLDHDHRSHEIGPRAASRNAVWPPSDWPTTTTGSRLRRSRHSTASFTNALADRSAISSARRPWPRCSSASTRWLPVSHCAVSAHSRAYPARPWSNTTGVPVPPKSSSITPRRYRLSPLPALRVGIERRAGGGGMTRPEGVAGGPVGFGSGCG